jgi:predicted Rossmann fold flavoprotein
VEFLMSRRIGDVERRDGEFRVKTSRETLASASLVVATGGLSASTTGASGFGFELARRFGLGIIAPEPALVGLRWSEGDRRRWVEMAGVTLPEVVVSCGGREFREALLFTHTGISGPAVLPASLWWREGEPVSVDLLPGLDPRAWFKAVRLSRGSARPEEILDQRLPRRFVDIFSEEQLPGVPLARLSDADIEVLASKIKGWKFTPAGTEGYDRAEVTRGGVDTTELSSQTMECRKVPGLYFIGEVVDVTGRLGGFNLHWAWASGAAAGRAA